MTLVVTPERDGKLAELRQLIEHKVGQPTWDRDGCPNRKLLVFTAFVDTARNLYGQIAPWARRELGIHVALIVGDGGNQTTLGGADYDDILTNFSPRAKRRTDQPRFPQSEEIDLLMATDCISEGQNLQDCGRLVNIYLIVEFCLVLHWEDYIWSMFTTTARCGFPSPSPGNPCCCCANWLPARPAPTKSCAIHSISARARGRHAPLRRSDSTGAGLHRTHLPA